MRVIQRPCRSDQPHHAGTRIHARCHQGLRKIIDVLDFPHVHSDQGLDLALERMGANQIDLLPVVDRANVHRLEGIVTLRDVLEFYGVSSPNRP